MIELEYVQANGLRKVVARIDGQPVGEVVWAELGMVMNIFVNPEHQGKGIATTMWEYANSEAVPLDQRPIRPKETDARTESGEFLYWKARRRREAREAGETPPSALKE